MITSLGWWLPWILVGSLMGLFWGLGVCSRRKDDWGDESEGASVLVVGVGIMIGAWCAGVMPMLFVEAILHVVRMAGG